MTASLNHIRNFRTLAPNGLLIVGLSRAEIRRDATSFAAIKQELIRRLGETEDKLRHAGRMLNHVVRYHRLMPADRLVDAYEEANRRGDTDASGILHAELEFRLKCATARGSGFPYRGD